jgi:hypothetical protein
MPNTRPFKNLVVGNGSSDYTLFMIRRALYLLLLCMAMMGLAPSWACASTPQNEDCCPPGKSSPCAPDRSTQGATLACCLVQAPQSAMVAVTQVTKITSVSFDSSANGVAPTIPTAGSLAVATHQAVAQTQDWQDQSLLYLQTGRLRL